MILLRLILRFSLRSMCCSGEGYELVLLIEVSVMLPRYDRDNCYFIRGDCYLVLEIIGTLSGIAGILWPG